LLVLCYLLTNLGLGIFMSTYTSFELMEFCDSGWGTCPDS